MWRCKSINAHGVEALCESCTNIEELDFGWWCVGHHFIRDERNFIIHTLQLEK